MTEQTITTADVFSALDNLDTNPAPVPASFDYRPFYRQFGLPKRHWEQVNVSDLPQLLPTWEAIAHYMSRRNSGSEPEDAVAAALNLIVVGADTESLAGEFARAAVHGGMTPFILKFADLLEAVDASMDYDSDYLDLVRRVESAPYLALLGVHSYAGISGRACARMERVVERIENRDMPWVTHFSDASGKNPFKRLRGAGRFGRQVLMVTKPDGQPRREIQSEERVEEPKSNTDAILATVGRAKLGANITFIERGTGLDRSVVGPELDALVKSGRLAKDEAGRYRLVGDR